MPLSFATKGSSLTVKRISGKDDIKRFLESLGFVSGAQVTVLSEMGGNLILNVMGARIALNKGMANRIFV